MTEGKEKTSTLWLFALALAWPMDIYQTVPGLRVPLSALLAVCYVVTVVLERRKFGFRIPFELWWPVVPIVALGWGQVSRAHGAILSVEFILAVLLFVAAAGSVRNRYVVEWALFFSVMSGAVLAMINFAAFKAGIPSTTYAMESGVTMSGSASVGGGMLQNALLLVVAVGLIGRSEFGPLHRTAATFAAIPLAGSFGGQVWQSKEHVYDWGQSLLSSQGPSYWISLALLVWLLARLMGKVAADRRANGDGLHGVFLVGILLAVGCVALVPIHVRLHHGLMLGLVAAYVLPRRVDKPYYFVSPAWYVLPTVLIVLLVINLPGTAPRSELDRRDFDTDAELEMAGGTYNHLRWRMENLYTLYPGEASRLGMWQAAASTRLRAYERGSLEYMWALGQSDEAERPLHESEAMLMSYRDLETSGEENTMFHERILAAQQGIEAALPILALNAEKYSRNDSSGVPRSLQAAGLAFLLGDMTWEETLAAGDRAVLEEAMRCDEVSVVSFSADNSFPMDSLLIGYLRTPDGPQVLAVSPEHRAISTQEIRKKWHIRPESETAEPSLHLDDTYTVEDGAQRAVAILNGDGEDAVPLAYIYANADGSLAVNWNTALGIREFPYTARVMVLRRSGGESGS